MFATITPEAGNHPRVRRSVRELEKRPEELNAFLRAWKLIKALPPDDPNSFWVVGGYHGQPFKPRQVASEAEGWGGWCQHANVLFPTWHRFYILRLEQALRFVSRPGDNVAMPYWDPTSDESLEHGLPRTLTDATVTIDGKQEPNPLLSFTFPEQIGEAHANDFYEKPKGYKTVRYPWSGIMSPPEAKEEAERHNKRMREILPNPTELLNRNVVHWLNRGIPHTFQSNSTHNKYRKCLKETSYNAFSNTHSAGWERVSLEQPHNDIHLAIGGFDTPVGAGGDRSIGLIEGANGDMGASEIASFDPIFFFHHCNVDRVFWIWQKIQGHKDHFDIVPGDPGTNPSRGQGPTPRMYPNQELKMDTPLHPFHHPNGHPVTSKDCINIETQLGYTYSKGSLEGDVEVSRPQPEAVTRRRITELHTVNNLADNNIHALLDEADKKQDPPRVVVDVTNVQDWDKAEGTPMAGPKVKIPTARFKWTGKDKIEVDNIDRDKYPGSFLIRAYYKQIDPQHFIGQVGIFDRWQRKACANCQFHRFADTSFNLKEFMLTWPPKVNSDFKVQVVYKDPVKGTQVKEEITPGDPARSGDDVPGPTFKFLRVFTPKPKGEDGASRPPTLHPSQTMPKREDGASAVQQSQIMT